MKYRKVDGAWVVLDPNGVSQLYILFGEEPAEPYDLKPEDKHIVMHSCSDGMVYYCAFDPDGKRWASRSGVVNRTYPDVEVIDIVEVCRGTRMGRTGAITKSFAEEILKQFDLPFQFVLGEDSTSDKRYDLQQIHTEDFDAGIVTTNSKGEEVVVLDVHWSAYGSAEQFSIMTKGNDSITYAGYKELPSLYKGLTWDEYLKATEQYRFHR